MSRRLDAVLERLAYTTEGQALSFIVELALVAVALPAAGRALRPTQSRGAP